MEDCRWRTWCPYKPSLCSRPYNRIFKQRQKEARHSRYAPYQDLCTVYIYIIVAYSLEFHLALREREKEERSDFHNIRQSLGIQPKVAWRDDSFAFQLGRKRPIFLPLSFVDLQVCGDTQQ